MTKVNINKPEEEKIYKIGDMFVIPEHSTIYILAKVQCGLCNLISITTGNRYTENFTVNDISKITEEELKAGLNVEFFKLVKEVTITVHE